MKVKRLAWYLGLALVALLFANLAYSEDYVYGSPRKKIIIPDILGYITLKCDFHMHTVFSDGSVWPDVRANEIWVEGLDALSITDHIEYIPFASDLPKNLNRSTQIAEQRAGLLNMIYIKGAEITRSFTPNALDAHFNALFIDDINLLDVPETKDVLKAAVAQGAFVFWNHPPQDWGPDIEEVYANGLLNGIEIINGDMYSTNAHRWALEKNLTILGNTDVHDPMYLKNGQHRTMTLVFAKEKNKEAVKEALINRRTAVYYGADIYGDQKYLKAIFDASVAVVNQKLIIKDGNPARLVFQNNSQIPFRLVFDNPKTDVSMKKEIIVSPNGKTTVKIGKANTGVRGQTKDISIPYKVMNLVVAPNKYLDTKLSLSITFE